MYFSSLKIRIHFYKMTESILSLREYWHNTLLAFPPFIFVNNLRFTELYWLKFSFSFLLFVVVVFHITICIFLMTNIYWKEKCHFSSLKKSCAWDAGTLWIVLTMFISGEFYADWWLGYIYKYFIISIKFSFKKYFF